jgi:crossover junction endodeoxyribonuclease RuvC
LAAGLDLSLTGTGVAGWSPEDGWYTATIVTRGSNTDTVEQTHRRLRSITGKVLQHVHTISPKVVVIESPTFSSNTGHARDRAGLFWLVYDALEQADVRLAVCKANTRIKYALGKGVGNKDAVLAATIKRYTDADIRNNNEADAVLLAAMGARWHGVAPDPYAAFREDAVRAVTWPQRL